MASRHKIGNQGKPVLPKDLVAPPAIRLAVRETSNSADVAPLTNLEPHCAHPFQRDATATLKSSPEHMGRTRTND